MPNFKKTIPEIREELFSYIEQVQDEYAKKGFYTGGNGQDT